MNKGIAYIALLIGGAPVYLLSKLFPKKPGLCIIGSNLGKYFADNPKYFFLMNYGNSNPEDRKNLVWISRSKAIVAQLKSRGLPAEYLYSVKGMFTVLRAETAYISHQLKDIHGPLMGGARIIQLWHAMALRKVGYGGDWNDDTLKGKLQDFISKWLPYAYYMTCDRLLAPCQKAKEYAIEPFSRSFRNGNIADNIFMARQPRTICFEKTFVLDDTWFPERKKLDSYKMRYAMIVAWLPTQRRQLGKTIVDIILDSGMDLEKLNAYCARNNYLFVIKAHFLDFEQAAGLTVHLDNIVVYPHEDPYPLLRYTDVLVTDYSSVFFDFLLTNRPILFMSYDLESYRRKVRFYYDYENLGIGPICHTWSAVVSELEELRANNDRYSKLRADTLQNFDFVMETSIKIPDS